MAYANTNPYTDKVSISTDQMDRLIDDPRVRAVAMTGSEAADSADAARAGKNLRKSTRALGGSDFTMLENADMASAAKHALVGGVGKTGQVQTSSKRSIVVEALADSLLEKFLAALSDFQPYDPVNKAITLLPLPSRAPLATLVH